MLELVMEIFVLGLFILAVIISVLPEKVEATKVNNCENGHEWVEKQVEEVNGSYITCKRCKFLVGGDYEA